MFGNCNIFAWHNWIFFAISQIIASTVQSTNRLTKLKRVWCLEFVERSHSKTDKAERWIVEEFCVIPYTKQEAYFQRFFTYNLQFIYFKNIFLDLAFKLICSWFQLWKKNILNTNKIDFKTWGRVLPRLI